MMYRVELSREAQRFYERCASAVARKLSRCFEALERSPRAGNNIKALKGKLAGSYRYRLGNPRVVYAIMDREAKVCVITIAKRSDVYE
jgi:mRNA interferase RelE/StbE